MRRSDRVWSKWTALLWSVAGVILVCTPLAAQPLTGRETDPRAESAQTGVDGRVEEMTGLIGAERGYRIGPGDVLQVSVWREPEVSVEAVVVRSDGKISMPLIKEVEANGLTPGDFESLLKKALARFIKDPDVTVIVREINSQRIHVVGGVREPGVLPLEGSMTVLQALARAGGPTEFAKKSKIYVLRKAGGRTERLSFDYKAVMDGKISDDNVLLRSGDTVVVPE